MIDTDVVLARAALYIVALGLAGIPLYLRMAGLLRAQDRLRASLAGGAFVAGAISIWWAAASVAAMAAMPLSDLDYVTFSLVTKATPIGTVLYVRLAACMAVLLLAALYPSTLWLGLVGAVISIAGVWTGHAGAAQGALGHGQRLLDAVHLVGAAAWFGALLVFVGAVTRMAGEKNSRLSLISRLQGFATAGTIIVSALVFTGAINGWLIARHGFAWSSQWSVLLIAKLALFAVMLILASLNRWKLTPAFKARKQGALARLRLSLALEAACAIAIFALVAIIGLNDPGAVS